MLCHFITSYILRHCGQPDAPEDPAQPGQLVLQAFSLQNGDKVVYSKFAGTEIELEGSEHVILKVGFGPPGLVAHTSTHISGSDLLKSVTPLQTCFSRVCHLLSARLANATVTGLVAVSAGRVLKLLINLHLARL